MDDEAIVKLYFERNEWAISETQNKYGRYCHSIANNILHSDEDAEECVNDTYCKAWDSIPPEKPRLLAAFLGRITRNLAINRYLYNRAEKRDKSVETALDELEDIIPSGDNDPSDGIALRDAINGFLARLPKNSRIIFVQRYWYMLSVKEIAEGHKLTEGNVRVILLRTREKFREYLEKEGITV